MAHKVGLTCPTFSATASTSTNQLTSPYTYDANGNMTNDSVNGNWNYSYDQLNRLACASVSSNTACAFPPTGTPTYTYVYDRFGNRWQQNSPAGGIYTSSLTFTGNGTTNSNRMDGYCYDSAGNLLDNGACPSSGPHQYAYDAENRLISSNYGASTYTYNAEGERITKTTGGVTMTYTYDRDGHLFETYGQTNSLMENYVDGRHLGTWDWNSNDTGTIYHYTHADWLGTERARIDVSGNVCETITSLPFGDGMTTSGSCADTSNLHFTGKERDFESGLDNFGARYDASNFGRFMTSDMMGGHQEDPQTLNKYAYVRNNPLNLTDPTGLDFYLQCTDEKHNGCTQVQIDPNNTNQTWVQANENGTAKIITSDSIRAGQNGATVDENGVTINGNNQGIYFDNPASHTTDANGHDVNNNPIDLAGSGALKDFSFTINGNCSGSCLSSGTWSFPGSLEEARATLYGRGSFSFPGEDEKADLGYGDHPYSTQHRFGASTCPFFSCRNSPHISVPNSWVPVPKDTVPQGFHVDAHGSFIGHQQDVQRKGVE